jgi:hypothetical protein
MRDAVRRIGHGRTTSSHELERVGQGLFKHGWQGVVPRDRIPAAKTGGYLICNLQTSQQGGSHWVCRAGSIWHDPLGAPGVAQAMKLRQQLGPVTWTDMDAEQRESEDNCGQRCIAALMLAKQCGMQAFLLL